MSRPNEPAVEPAATPGVEDASAEYAVVSEEYRRYIQEGLDDITAGRVVDWEVVKAEARAKYGTFKT